MHALTVGWADVALAGCHAYVGDVTLGGSLAGHKSAL